MKKKINLLFLIIMVLLCFTFGCQNSKSNANEQTTLQVTPLFYKLTDKKTNTSIYLLGSIHAADDSIYPLNEKIMDAFDKSDYLAVEVDTVELTNDFSKQVELAKKMLYTDGSTIKDNLGEDLYNKVVSKLKEKKAYNSLYDNYKPTFFESLFENLIINDSGMDAMKGIDIYFLNLAKEKEKEILEVETAELQYDLLLSTPLELDKAMLEDYIDNYDDNVLQMKEIYEIWKTGDKEKLEEKLLQEDYEDMTDDEIKMFNDYNNSLIIDRNYGMVKTLEQYFKEQKNVFCVVGLGHVVGDEGIVRLMQKKGYTVEKID